MTNPASAMTNNSFNKTNNGREIDTQMLQQMANGIRVLAMDAVEKAASGHPGMPMGMADVATVLFTEHLRFSAKHPKWRNRDRFVLSAGHGSMLLYALLYLTGYEDISLDDIKNFRQLHSKAAGHPEYGLLAGIETTTGPLGQGLANAVGFALAEKMLASRLNAGLGEELINHYTYVIAGDGCLMEGISQEAISLAGHLNLNKLIVLFDDNKISIDGATSLATSEDQLARFKASGFNVSRVNGHDFAAISAAIAAAKASDRPSLIACETIIAYPSPGKAGSSASHGSPLGKEEVLKTKQKLAWEGEAFAIPEHILQEFRKSGQKYTKEAGSWEAKYAALPEARRAELDCFINNDLSDAETVFDQLKQNYAQNKPNWATRKSSGEILQSLAKTIPNLIGGSADLTGSNLTKADVMQPIKPGDFSGRYIYYGVREHAMAAIMNGLALYGSFIPFSGTFLVFSDYCRPSIRLSALMKQRVIYVLTHDSIGLGEDGPTHQPVEHLASLRAIPNLQVFRPADVTETLECWQIALNSKTTPSVLALTRQNVPSLRTYTKENLCARGAYILAEAASPLKVTIFATGSEVQLAVAAKNILEAKNLGVRVVSVPCAELFFKQDKDYKVNFLCNDSVKIVVEAAVKFGWERFLGPHGVFVGMESFGESAPIDALYQYFNITVDSIVEKALGKLQG